MVKKLMRLHDVVFQQSTQSFASANGVGVPALVPRTWQQSFIASSLMMAFLMIMGAILVEHFPEGVFPKQDEP